MASPAENEAVVREALTYWGDRAVASNGTERGRVRIRGQFDQALAVLAALRAQAEAGEQAREALRAYDVAFGEWAKLVEMTLSREACEQWQSIARAALTGEGTGAEEPCPHCGFRGPYDGHVCEEQT